MLEFGGCETDFLTVHGKNNTGFIVIQNIVNFWRRIGHDVSVFSDQGNALRLIERNPAGAKHVRATRSRGSNNSG